MDGWMEHASAQTALTVYSIHYNWLCVVYTHGLVVCIMDIHGRKAGLCVLSPLR
jgi:hypothetical protein